MTLIGTRKQDDKPLPQEDPDVTALIAAMRESMDRFEETYRLLATEALSDDPAP